MDADQALDMIREAMLTALVLSAPVLAVALLAGLVIGLAQALTQIHDHTVAFVPKLIVMAVALSLLLPWITQRLIEYAQGVFENIPTSIAGG